MIYQPSLIRPRRNLIIPASKFQIHGYFYIHNRMPSSLFDTLEDAEDSAEYLLNQSTYGATFYRATKPNIAYIQHWNPHDTQSKSINQLAHH